MIIINSYMNYLVPMFDCVAYGKNVVDLKAYVKYKFHFDNDEKVILWNKCGNCSILIDFNEQNKSLLKVKYKFDTYHFLFNNFENSPFFTSWKLNNKILSLSVARELIISIDGEVICKELVNNLCYSHYEILNNICYVYFEGKRNYVVAIKSDKVLFATYYDECNIKHEAKYFMCRLNDSLNHGKVYEITGENFTSFLVYLDDEALNLKSEFVSLVFLDCLMAGNLKYCNNLLCDNLKMQDESNISHFFEDFDFIFPIDETTVILLKKNTLAGIYSFEIKDNLIYNITNLT